MLVITRRIGQSIIVDEQTQVKILHVQGGQIRLGIEAPRAVTVDREEIHERKKRNVLLAESVDE